MSEPATAAAPDLAQTIHWLSPSAATIKEGGVVVAKLTFRGPTPVALVIVRQPKTVVARQRLITSVRRAIDKARRCAE